MPSRKCSIALGLLRRELQADFDSRSDQTLGKPTFNIGTIRGGTKINIVPDACEASVDIRTIPKQDLTALLDSFENRCPGVKSSAKGHPGR